MPVSLTNIRFQIVPGERRIPEQYDYFHTLFTRLGTDIRRLNGETQINLSLI